MKKIIYSIFTVVLLAFTGCVQDNILQPDPPTQAGDEVAVRFSVNIPEYKTVTTRATGGVNDLILLVFDEQGKFIYSRSATLASQTETGGTFTVMMQPTTQKRTIHFISNYVFPDNFHDQSTGKTEQEVITALESSHLLFWNRTVLAGGISETPNPGQFNGGQAIELLRNQAKISVVSTEPKFEMQGFALYKVPDKGTAAPFDASEQAFTIGSVTQAAGASLSGEPAPLDFTSDEKYLFERVHKSNTDYTAVIVKGLYKETPSSPGELCYYKIDLLDKSLTPAVRYDIERNYHYKVTVNKVNMVGVDGISSAVNGAAANNVVLDASLDKFPMISDGKEKMEIEKTVVLFTEPGKPLSVQTNYWPDITADPEHIDNSGMTLYVEGETSIFGTQPAISASGLITATIANTLPVTLVEASIVVSKGNMSRKLRVVATPPFTFDPKINNANPGTVGAGQDAVANLTFTIPADFPEGLFPFDVKIYTQGLYYTKSSGAPDLQMKVENGVIYYIYTAASPGLKTLPFKTNNAGNAETVVLKADGFTGGPVAYNSSKREGSVNYVKSGVSTPVPYADKDNLSISNGFITIKQGEDGQFIWNYTSGTAATVEAVKWEGNKGYLYRATNVATSATTINLNYVGLKQATGTITYGANNPVPAGTTLEVTANRGQIKVTENGRYLYTLPATYNNSDAVTMRYYKAIGTTTNGTVSEIYETTTTVGNLTNGTINIGTKLSNIVIAGTIQYDYSSWGTSEWRDVPVDDGDVTKTAGPGTFAMTGGGSYRLTIPANTGDATNITITYQSGWWSSWSQTKTFDKLKTDAGWQLN